MADSQDRSADLLPALESGYHWVKRAIQTGCCGHPDGPTWTETKDYLFENGVLKPTGKIRGKWVCRFAGPEGCSWNWAANFNAEFAAWIDRGLPLYEPTEQARSI